MVYASNGTEKRVKKAIKIRFLIRKVQKNCRKNGTFFLPEFSKVSVPIRYDTNVH